MVDPQPHRQPLGVTMGKRRAAFALLFGVLAAIVTAITPLPLCAADSPGSTPGVFAVSPQYDTTHVYVPAEDFEQFVASIVATFGGRALPAGVVTVTPEPSKAKSQLVLTPAGTISAFGYETPIPYPFGAERMGYLLDDFDKGVRAAQKDGADLIVRPFPDPLGRDAIVQWPGGVTMQLYWHTTAPNYPALSTVPESRVYVAPSRANEFVRDYLAFSNGTIVDDKHHAPGVEIGRPNASYRRIRITSQFGRLTVLVTDGVLPYPFGRELAGYEVPDLLATLQKAKAASVVVLVEPYVADGRRAAIVQFPGGYIAEIHETVPR
jgi:hypothetical protein